MKPPEDLRRPLQKRRPAAEHRASGPHLAGDLSLMPNMIFWVFERPSLRFFLQQVTGKAAVSWAEAGPLCVGREACP